MNIITIKETYKDKDISITACRQGSNLVVSLSGGDLPHIGSVALSQPRPSLADPSMLSATSSILSVVGHKEGSVAESAANRLASSLNTIVAVACGIHYDNGKPEDFPAILSIVDRLVAQLIDELQKSTD
ncbi:prenylated flavin chaperone LpdD [Parasporobacterium paucivorans]|uniref:Prenylated flavin chaperone LpdD-like domain-containing protein n=1 Tax=Parasporobacterium paucivorans DSM 15970 TaxID=1122934 RepID=A0A1M6E3Y1_9FIRM|nr:hypothetical protein [Parasporobacterium paucivorans]SHI80207.1 hypothetical protein SAMN02745691_00851 [Parasporobacterium paucivorans DSM 15970]